MAKERIGIMGGTFNPIHSGHIVMAKAAKKTANLDRVLMLPSGTPPHKTDIAPAIDRYRCVCAAVAMEEGLEPCSLEIDRPGVTYTVDTLTALHEKYPKAELYYMIGTDTVMELKNWRDYTRVLKLCTFLVCPRVCKVTAEEVVAEQRRLSAMGGSFISVNMDVVDISSTELREALATGEKTPLLPPQVREYCTVLGLYSGEKRLPNAAEWLDNLYHDLSPKRFAHTLCVAYTARNLARIHGVDEYRAETAALLHDCAKCLPLKEMQKLSREHQLTSDIDILASDNLLHSFAGAYLAAQKYGITDAGVLHAISAHTTGRAGMTKLDMVVYLADKIEPSRASYPLLDKVRMMATLSLEKAMLTSMEGTVSYVQKSGKKVHPQTLETLTWIKSTCKGV